MEIIGILTPEQVAAGYGVRDDEDFVYLHHGEREIAVFLASTCTPAMVQAEVDEDMKRCGSG